MSSPEFRSKVESLASSLSVPPHPDAAVTLEACCVLIREHAAAAAGNRAAAKVIA